MSARIGQKRGFRLTLTGAMDNPIMLRKALAQLTSQEDVLVTDSRGTVLFIDKINNETILGVDLLAVAKDTNPEGLLARRILILENLKQEIPGVEDPESLREILISRGRETLAQVDGQMAYLDLPDHLDADEIAQQMAQTGRQALEEILSRKEVGHEA